VGAAVAAQIESVDVPARGERRDDGEEALPVRGAAVDHDEGWAGVGTFGVVERDLTRVEALLVEHGRRVPSSVEAVSGVAATKRKPVALPASIGHRTCRQLGRYSSSI